jgi:SPP1 gp7 family putative phage head morphogenesis protein
MAQGKLQQVTSHYRAQLLAHQQQAEQQLEAWYKYVLATIQPRLNTLYKQIGDMQQSGETIPPSWLYEKNRLGSIKQLIVSHVGSFAHNAAQVVLNLQHVGAALGQQAASAQLEATVPTGIDYQFGVPSLKAITDMVGTLQDGSPLADLFATFGEQAAKDVQSALITGLTLGDNPRKVARSVEQALDVPRSRALTIARTEMIRPYRSAALETYNENSDVVDQWVWIADLSGRTCAACIAMNGTLHDLSEDFESHVNCRCSPSPQTKSWADILPDVDLSGIEETSVQVQDGSEWFDQQDASTQKQILGSNAAYAAYKDGAITLNDLVGKQHSDAWGTSRYQKSLKEAIGAKQAQKYYKKAS